MKLQTLAALAAGIALTSVASVLAIGAFDTNHAAARAAVVAHQHALRITAKHLNGVRVPS